MIIIIIIIIMSLFYEDDIFSTTTNLTYGPRLKNKHENHKTIFTVYILTYRNNPSYTSMGILIYLSVRSNTDQIRMKLRLFQAHLMCSRNRVLIYALTS